MYDSYGMSADEQFQQQQAYGQYGAGGPNMGGFGGFEDFFKSSSFGEDFIHGWEDILFNKKGNKYKNEPVAQGRDINIELELDFMEAIKGCQKEITVEKTELCKTCKGSKCKPGTSTSSCSSCRGRGTVVERRGPIIFQSDCPYCGATGQVIKNPCATCHGIGLQTKSITEIINIPSGIGSDSHLRLSKKGNSNSKGNYGDILIKIRIRPHKYFRRDGFDIHSDKEITFTQAVLGGSIKVSTIFGPQAINISPGTKHGDIKKIIGQGVPKLPSHYNSKGNHYVHLNIRIPTNLSSHAKNILKEYAKCEPEIEDDGDDDASDN